MSIPNVPIPSMALMDTSSTQIEQNMAEVTYSSLVPVAVMIEAPTIVTTVAPY